MNHDYTCFLRQISKRYIFRRAAELWAPVYMCHEMRKGEPRWPPTPISSKEVLLLFPCCLRWGLFPAAHWLPLQCWPSESCGGAPSCGAPRPYCWLPPRPTKNYLSPFTPYLAWTGQKKMEEKQPNIMRTMRGRARWAREVPAHPYSPKSKGSPRRGHQRRAMIR